MGSSPTSGSMKIFTYLLKSLKDESFYVGITSDLKQRLEYHNGGHVKSTALKKPYVLVYIKEHVSYTEARKHEKWLKKKNKAYKNKLTLPLVPPL